jgi:hypothetical protein
MPGTFVLPPAGSPFGPGANFILTDTTIGPFPVDDQVTIELWSPSPELRLGQYGAVSVQSSQFLGKWTVPDFTTAAWNFLNDGATIPIGAPLNLIGRRAHADGTTVWQTSVPVTWAPTQFIWQMDWETLWRRGASTQVGIDTKDAVTALLADTLGRLRDFPLVDYWLGSPPPQFLVRGSETFLLQDEGDLTVPVGRYGLIWQWITVPAGIGRRPGVPTLFHAEMMVLTEIHRDAGLNEFAINRLLTQTEGIPYGFMQPQPTRIHYQVLPFVVGVGQWLQLPPA